MSYDKRTLTSSELGQKLDENKIKGIKSMAKTLSAELLNYKEPLKSDELGSIILRVRDRLIENIKEYWD